MFQITKILGKGKTLLLCFVAMPFVCLPSLTYAADDHGQDDRDALGQREMDQVKRDEYDEHEGHEEAQSIIATDIAMQSGISVAKVSSMTLEILTQAYGKLVIPPNQEAHIHARFPGLVKGINVHVGDRVSKGDVLAVIESHESLRDYTVTAPMSGIVTKRQLNLGEVTDDEPLVEIVDDDVLWAELKVFPHQRSAVKPGQLAYLARERREVAAKITHIAPSDNQAPYMLARVNVDNAQQNFTPGELVRADIVIETVNVPLAVENRALQTMEGEQVVFIQEGDTYQRRALKLGRTDGHFTEVLQGLQSGETYVLDNSYLIKADFEKSGAGHHH